MGLGKGMLRASIFYFPGLCLDLLALATSLLTNLFPYAVMLVFLPARKRNSWSGIHDMISKTRVVGKKVSDGGIWSSLESELDSGPFEHELGPYRIQTPYGPTAAVGAVILGFDPQLQRKVWVHVRAPGAPDLAIARRDLSVPFHLRWLNSKRSKTESWDVFEAPDGASLEAAAVGDQPWPVVRNWLRDLVEVSGYLLENQDNSEDFNTDNIWITTEGDLVWLDFPAPGVEPKEKPIRTNAGAWVGFQNLLFELCETASGSVGRKYQPRYPLGFSLLQKHLKEKTYDSVGAIKGIVEALYNKTVKLNLAYRLKMMALIVLYPLIAGIANLQDTSSILGGQGIFPAIYEPAMLWFFSGVPVWLVLGLVFKGGVMYQVFGIVVVTRDGLEASRIRRVVRTFLAWSPILLTWAWIIALGPYPNITDPGWPEGLLRPVFHLNAQFLMAIQQYHPVPLIMLAVFTIGGMWTLTHPDRGLHDRILGTYLVPR